MIYGAGSATNALPLELPSQRLRSWRKWDRLSSGRMRAALHCVPAFPESNTSKKYITFGMGCMWDQRKSPSLRFRGMKLKPERSGTLKLLNVAVSVVSLATLLFACPSSISCPADRAEMYQIGDEYSGSVHLAIYEHWTSAGVEHQVTIRCEK